jgi:peptide-methionine (S)-S-oxide reductase
MLRSSPRSSPAGTSIRYPVEGYHQDFLTRNPRYPYIVINDLPKIEDLKRLFPDLYRATPVLVAAARN